MTARKDTLLVLKTRGKTPSRSGMVKWGAGGKRPKPGDTEDNRNLSCRIGCVFQIVSGRRPEEPCQLASAFRKRRLDATPRSRAPPRQVEPSRGVTKRSASNNGLRRLRFPSPKWLAEWYCDPPQGPRHRHCGTAKSTDRFDSHHRCHGFPVPDRFFINRRRLTRDQAPC
jgi:hypothetical protein